MSKMGHVLVVPEEERVVCNGYIIHNIKPPNVSSMIKPKYKNKTIRYFNFAHFELNQENQPF